MPAKHRNVMAFLLTILFTVFGTAFAMDTANVEANANFGPGLQAPPPAQFKSLIFKEELTIGADGLDEHTTFGKILDIIIDDHGNIFVNDWDAKQIRKFGPDGKFIRNISRFGQGPEEFQHANSIGILEDGIFFIADQGKRGILYYDSEGVFIKQIDFPRGLGNIRISPIGTYFGTRHVYPKNNEPGDDNFIYTIFNNQFQPIIELGKYTIDSVLDRNRGMGKAKYAAFMANYFLNKPTTTDAMGNDGRIYFGINDKYSIDVYSPDGKKLHTIKHECQPIPYGNKDKDIYFSDHELGWEKAGFSDTMIKEIRGLINFPKFKPFFTGFIPMEDSRLAVLVDQSGFDSSTLDIFDQQGRFQGRITAPISPMLRFKNGKAYCVHTDPEGYLSVKRYSYELK